MSGVGSGLEDTFCVKSDKPATEKWFGPGAGGGSIFAAIFASFAPFMAFPLEQESRSDNQIRSNTKTFQNSSDVAVF